jgi:hypothetical protein
MRIYVNARASLVAKYKNEEEKTMKKNVETIVKHAEVSEKVIEAYLVKCITKMGLLCLKYSNPGMVGYPDRLIVLPNGMVIWAELKSKGKKLSAVQTQRFTVLKIMGHFIAIIDSKEGVDNLCKSLTAYMRDLIKQQNEERARAAAAEEGAQA